MIIERTPYVFAKPWHRDFPPMLVVSITNACNLRCVHCFHSRYSSRPEYRRNFLPWEIWERICREAASYPGVIMNFGTDGEPMLHPRFLDMLRCARAAGLRLINVTTNGTLLSRDLNAALVGEGLTDVMNISLDAFTAETYKKIRGGSLNVVLKGLHDLIERRNAAKSLLKIQVNIIDQPEAAAELDAFRAFWSSRVDHVMVRTYYDATVFTGETGRALTSKEKPFEQIDRWPCQQLWRRFNIADDGTARFCVDDWFNKTEVGDLRKNSIHDIWTSPRYDELRALHIAGRFSEIPYCTKCTEWQGMRWDYDYFTALNKMLGRDILGGA